MSDAICESASDTCEAATGSLQEHAYGPHRRAERGDSVGRTIAAALTLSAPPLPASCSLSRGPFLPTCLPYLLGLSPVAFPLSPSNKHVLRPFFQPIHVSTPLSSLDPSIFCLFLPRLTCFESLSHLSLSPMRLILSCLLCQSNLVFPVPP